MPRILAVVPARQGSKRIEGKNMRRLAGSPLIVWTLEAALSAKTIDEVVITSDYLELMKLTELYERVVNHWRDADLCGDGVPDYPVVKASIDRYERTQRVLADTDIVVFLRPTAPFRKPEEIDDVVARLIQDEQADSVRSVQRTKWHPQKAYLWSSYRLVPYTSDHRANHPSQDLEPVCYATGFIDAMRVGTLRRHQDMDGITVKPWLSPEDRSVDLDTLDDWKVAEDLALANHWGPGRIT